VQQILFLGERGDWMKRANEVGHTKRRRKKRRCRYFALRCAIDFDFDSGEDVIG
jgi:hypothetical protein